MKKLVFLFVVIISFVNGLAFAYPDNKKVSDLYITLCINGDSGRKQHCENKLNHLIDGEYKSFAEMISKYKITKDEDKYISNYLNDLFTTKDFKKIKRFEGISYDQVKIISIIYLKSRFGRNLFQFKLTKFLKRQYCNDFYNEIEEYSNDELTCRIKIAIYSRYNNKINQEMINQMD